MFDFLTPYYDMYKTSVSGKHKGKPTKLHRKECPVCKRKLVTLYYCSQQNRYICYNCTKELQQVEGI